MTKVHGLSRRIGALVGAAEEWSDASSRRRREAMARTLGAPNSFTEQALNQGVEDALGAITADAVEDWIGSRRGADSRRTAVLNAGNVPLVGLQDFLAVVLCGHQYLGVLSRKSRYLLPAFVESVRERDPSLGAEFVSFDDGLANAEVLIATGSSATVELVASRFESAGVPRDRQLLRGTRYGAAFLDGTESDQQLDGLARDALLHDGRGCRNVSTILALGGADPTVFAEHMDAFRRTFPAHPSTRAAVARARRFLDAVQQPYLAGDGFLLLEVDVQLREPGVIRWVKTDDASAVASWVFRHAGSLQVVVGNPKWLGILGREVDVCDFGESQRPPLDWRPDGLDTIAFLTEPALQENDRARTYL